MPIKGKIVIGFKKRNYRRGRTELIETIKREIARTTFGKKKTPFKKTDFGISFSDAGCTASFANAEIAYFPDMYALKVFAAPKGKKLYFGYEIGKNYMLEIPMTCFAIKTINGKRLEAALAKLRG